MDKTIEQLEVELAQARSVAVARSMAVARSVTEARAVAEARAWARVDSLEAEIKALEGDV